MISIKAYAKVNLGLDVLRKREDGYHEVKMIMQQVGLYDELIFEKSENKEIILKIEAENEEKYKKTISEVPLDSTNLIYKAASMVIDRYNLKEGVIITLKKNIPVAAGMAGGSTDCAAAFKGMNLLFELGMSEKDMKEMGVKLGADVPYCIMGGTALSEGIGEVLTRLPDIPDCLFLIAKPKCSVSTKEVYTNLRANELSEEEHPDIDGMVKAIENNDLDAITQKMGNVLEKVTIPMHEEIRTIKNIMMDCGAENSLMSGSGPTVFGIFKDMEKAAYAKEELEKLKLTESVFVVGT